MEDVVHPTKIPHVTGYLHVALMNGVSGVMVAAEMHGRLLQSGMYRKTDRIKIAVVGDPSQIFPLVELLSPYNKYSIELFSEDITLWEWPTLDMLKLDCDNGYDGHLWYMHTKGASQAGRQPTPSTVHIYKNVAAWRGSMFDQMASLDRVPEGYSAAGAFLRPNHGVGRHFSGNFWWATADHIRSIPEASTDVKKERGKAETWIGSAPGELYNITTGWDDTTELYGFDGTFSLGTPTV